MDSEIKRIGVLTSGGDAPGMNAAIRAVVRTAVYNNIKVFGIRKGYEGLINADVVELKQRSVSDILHRGGTMLLTARSEEMRTEEGQKRCAKVCEVLELDALVIIGGDGSIKGAQALSKQGVNTIGIPATIDLDLPCTEYTIGFDTAVTTAMEAIGKIRDTSSSHERCSVVEVMGRNSGHIALWCALTGGAEDVLVPENKEKTFNSVMQQIIENRSKGKKHNMIIVAEGIGKSQELAQEITSVTGIATRATILGHLQRGGSPSALDRMHASVMGYKAVELIKSGIKNRLIIYTKGEYENIDYDEAFSKESIYNEKMYNMIKTLS